MSDAVIVALISLAGAFLMGLPGMFAFRAQRRKTSGEAYKLNGEASEIYAKGLAEAARREVERVKKDLDNSDLMRDCVHRIEIVESDLDDLVEVVVDWYTGIDILAEQLEPFAPPQWHPNGSHKKLVERLCKDRKITLKD